MRALQYLTAAAAVIAMGAGAIVAQDKGKGGGGKGKGGGIPAPLNLKLADYADGSAIPAKNGCANGKPWGAIAGRVVDLAGLAVAQARATRIGDRRVQVVLGAEVHPVGRRPRLVAAQRMPVQARRLARSWWPGSSSLFHVYCAVPARVEALRPASARIVDHASELGAGQARQVPANRVLARAGKSQQHNDRVLQFRQFYSLFRGLFPRGLAGGLGGVVGVGSAVAAGGGGGISAFANRGSKSSRIAS